MRSSSDRFSSLARIQERRPQLSNWICLQYEDYEGRGGKSVGGGRRGWDLRGWGDGGSGRNGETCFNAVGSFQCIYRKRGGGVPIQ